MVIKEETKVNLKRIRAQRLNKFSLHEVLQKRKLQNVVNRLIPARGNVYVMLGRKVDTKGKIVK